MKSNKEIQAQIDSVCQTLVKEEKGFSRSLTKTIIFYLFIVLLLIGNIVFLNVKILSLATPKNLAIVINTKIKNMIPRFSQNLKNQMEPQAKEAAKKSVALIASGIPYAKEMMKAQINIYANKMADDLEKKHMAKFEAVIDDALNTVNKNKDMVKDKALGQALAKQISENLDKELAKIIDKPFIDAVDKFRVETDKLRTKPVSQLTRKELAEKRFIVTWIYLVNNKAPGQGIFNKAIQTLNDTAESLQGAI